jgi:hypothetical protein
VNSSSFLLCVLLSKTAHLLLAVPATSCARVTKEPVGRLLCKKSRLYLKFLMFSRKKFVLLRKHTSHLQVHDTRCAPLAVIRYSSSCVCLDQLHHVLLVGTVQRVGKDTSTSRRVRSGCFRMWHSAELSMSSDCYEQTAGLAGAASHCLGTPPRLKNVLGSASGYACFCTIGCIT